MRAANSLCDIRDKIHTNDEKIDLLNGLNVVLKERHEIESNYNHLNVKFSNIQKEEADRHERHEHSRKNYLTELENRASELCKEHGKLLHQIEHVNWHLEGCTRHRPCLGRLPENGPKKIASNSSCVSSSAPTCNRPSAQANLKNTSERLIKSIIDLRKKSYIVQEKVEHEIKRKREMEKKLTDLRKDIARQKKSLTVRRHTPLPTSNSMSTNMNSSHCPAQCGAVSDSCASLPPIKKPFFAK